MAGTSEGPEGVRLDQLGYLEHSFPAFGLDVVLLDVVAIAELETVTTGSGTLYRGALENLLSSDVRDPRVDVFPINRVGRPLGMATVTEEGTVISGEARWDFETSAVADGGVGWVAFALVKP
jgi:hypothetical protein